MERSLELVFNPRSVAVIGASEVPGKASERRTRSLIQGGYKGDIYLINPKRSELFGRKAYPAITEIEGEVDLVMIVVAPRFLTASVADSVKMGAKGIIIITAGLGETGEEGKRIENEILGEAAKTGTFVIGPNCSGMFSASGDMNILGVPEIEKGPISVLAQSGNVIDSLTHYARMRKIGFSKIISVGNAIGVNFHEYIDYLKDDSDTKVIMTYLEGIKDGDNLVKVVRETSKVKPVIALKVGSSSAGARAAASHTGSLAGDDVIVDAAFRQAGVVRVSNVDELFDMAHVFVHCPMPQGMGQGTSISGQIEERKNAPINKKHPIRDRPLKEFYLCIPLRGSISGFIGCNDNYSIYSPNDRFGHGGSHYYSDGRGSVL